MHRGQDQVPASCCRPRRCCLVLAGRGLLCRFSGGLLPAFLAINTRVIPGPGIGMFSPEAGRH